MRDFVTKSMKLVLDSLDNVKTQKQILNKTKLSPRTFRYAVSRLKKLKLVKEFVSMKDARIRLCRRGEKYLSMNQIN